MIRQRSRGEAEHQQLLQTYTTGGTLKIEDPDVLDERIGNDRVLFERLSKILLCLVWAALVGIIAGIVLPWLGVDGGLLLVVSIAVFVLATMSTGAIIRTPIRPCERIYRETGFGSPNGVTIAAREARSIIADPGTVSGRKVSAVRA